MFRAVSFCILRFIFLILSPPFIMERFVSLTFLTLSLLLLAGCAAQKPLTEAEQAAQYGMTVDNFREQKAAAARMGMSFEEHMKTMQGDSSEGHDMNNM